MKVKNNSGVPQLRKTNWKHLFLVVLHCVVLFLSATSQSFTTTAGAAARALPKTSFSPITQVSSETVCRQLP